jgi:hypothetical protein
VLELAKCSVVEDAEGKRLAYVYFKPDNQVHADRAAISRDEARRVAAAVVKLPELLKGS